MADTTRKKKIENLISKYNISAEHAQYIICTDEDLLSLNDLKLKYDNPDIGKLPEWLSEEDLSLMIWKTIQQTKSKDPTLFEYITDEDLYQDIQIRIRKKSNKIKNFKYLKAMISKWILTITVNINRNKCYIPVSLNNTYTNDEGSSFEFSEIIRGQNDITTASICYSIDSISDKSIRQFLIIVGYLVCNISELQSMYYDIYMDSSEEIRHNLSELEHEIIENEFTMNSINKFAIGGKNKTLIKEYIKKVICILNLNIFQNKSGKLTIGKRFSVNSILDEIKYYLIQNKIFLK